MIPDPRVSPTMTVDEVAAALGVSRASAYEGAKTGAIPTIRIGRRILCPTASIRRLVALDDDEVPVPTEAA